MSTRPLGPAHQGRALIGRTAAALALAGAGVLAATGGANAAEACTTTGIGNGDPTGTDNTVNVYAAGDFTVHGAAEAEGVVVVGGDLSVDHEYNVGVAGGGSLVAPSKGSVMLRVGEDVTGTSNLHVGHGLDGQMKVGGAIDGKPAEGTAHASLGKTAALGAYADLTTTLRSTSGELAAEAANGTVTDEAPYVVFRGDGHSSTQVFAVDGGKLGSASQSVSVEFADIPDDATIVVNVTGKVHANVTDMRREGATAAFDQNGDNAGLGSYASRTVWNIVGDTSPDIAGSAQWVGSVLVPTGGGTTTIDVPGLNGRTWVAGDLAHTYAGGEFHNYPFTGSDDLTCTPGTPTDETTSSPTTTPTPESTTPASTPAPSDDSTETPSDDTTDTPSDDQSTAPSTDEDTPSTAPADVASPSPTDTTVVLAAGGTAAPTATATAQGEGVLAQTGANIVPFAIAAAVLVAAGATLLVLRRRRAV